MTAVFAAPAIHRLRGICCGELDEEEPWTVASIAALGVEWTNSDKNEFHPR